MTDATAGTDDPSADDIGADANGGIANLRAAMTADADGRFGDAIRAFDRAVCAFEAMADARRLADAARHAGRFHLQHGLQVSGTHLLARAAEAASRVSAPAEPALPTMQPDGTSMSRGLLVEGAKSAGFADCRHTVLAASRALADETDVDRLLVLVTETAARLCRADGAILLLRDADAGWTRPVVVDGDRSRLTPQHRLDDYCDDAQASVHRHAVACTGPEIVDDRTSDASAAEARGGCSRSSRLVLPLAVVDGLAQAVVVLSNGPAGETFDPQDIHRLEGVVGQFDASIRHVANVRLLRRSAWRSKWEWRHSTLELQLRDRALDSLTQGVMIVERHDGAAPRVLYVNRQFTEDCGYTLADMQRGGPGMLHGDADAPSGPDDPLRTLRHAAGPTLLRNFRKSGEPFWSETSVAPVQPGVQVSLHTDVTLRVEDDRRRRADDERLRSVFDLGLDGFVVFDDRQRLLRVNAAFEAFTGLSEAALAGIDIDGFEQRLAARCRPPKPDQPADVLRVDSKPPAVLWRRERRSSGRGLETVMFFRDITSDLESDRLKSGFLTTAAHELRTPLTSVFGFTELLLARKTLPPAQCADMLAVVHRQSAVLTRLIDEVLELARIEARGADGLDLRLQVLQPLVIQAARQASRSGGLERLDVRLPLEPIWMRLDAREIVRAIAQALSNALRFGGDAPVVVSLDEPPGSRRLGLRITDVGCGMSAGQLSRLFERFYRADGPEGSRGNGLGATSMKAIVELHGGQVIVTSTPGAGTEVTFWLDRPSDSAASPPPCR